MCYCDLTGVYSVRLYLILVLIVLFFLFQVEDAMLMFDKQTNRHRGTLILVLKTFRMMSCPF